MMTYGTDKNFGFYNEKNIESLVNLFDKSYKDFTRILERMNFSGKLFNFFLFLNNI